MPREIRLSLPDGPGVYRLLRSNGDILYIGKAASLHDRVNSHFRKQHGIHERTLEMLSQARAIAFEATATPLEAALLEADEIKRHRPPYNIAPYGSRRRISASAVDVRRRRARSVRSFHSRRWIDSGRSLERTVLLSRQDVGILIRKHSARATSGSAPRILNFRAPTSLPMPGCCGSAHVCGEKAVEITTRRMIRTPRKPRVASPPGRPSSCRSRSSGSRSGRRSRAGARCG
jgi:hypothetical protein